MRAARTRALTRARTHALTHADRQSYAWRGLRRCIAARAGVHCANTSRRHGWSSRICSGRRCRRFRQKAEWSARCRLTWRSSTARTLKFGSRASQKTGRTKERVTTMTAIRIQNGSLTLPVSIWPQSEPRGPAGVPAARTQLARSSLSALLWVTSATPPPFTVRGGEDPPPAPGATQACPSPRCPRA